jgi:hypothetical protein
MAVAKRIKTVFQFRRATTAEWDLNKDVIPAAGEPCFDLDLGTLKIGNGRTTYENLETIGGVKFEIATDGKSIVLDDNVLKLVGFDAAEAGAQPRKTKDGNIEWIVPSTETVDGLKSAVAGLQSDVTNIQNNVTTIQESVTNLETNVTEITQIVMPANEGEGTLLDRVEGLEKELNTLVSGLTPDGKVNTMIELIEYVGSHGKEAADMASDILALQDLVGTVSVEDQINAIVNASGHMAEAKAKAIFENVKYEVSHKPAGTLVDYRDKEIRIMIPANTEFAHQSSGANADANSYYIGFKAYAPDGAVSFKEDLAEIIADNTMYYFDGNEFAGVDAYGRKYSIVWLPVANYANGVWNYHGTKSSKTKYTGWHYSVEWYDVNGAKIGADCIRVNLSNEACHNNIEPFYMSNVVKSVSVNGTLLDMIDGKVDITVPEFKSSDEIIVNEDGTLSIKAISFDKLTQDEESVLVMDGGGAV